MQVAFKIQKRKTWGVCYVEENNVDVAFTKPKNLTPVLD